MPCTLKCRSVFILHEMRSGKYFYLFIQFSEFPKNSLREALSWTCPALFRVVNNSCGIFWDSTVVTNLSSCNFSFCRRARSSTRFTSSSFIKLGSSYPSSCWICSALAILPSESGASQFFTASFLARVMNLYRDSRTRSEKWKLCWRWFLTKESSPFCVTLALQHFLWWMKQ
jgi:hypothetical protein